MTLRLILFITAVLVIIWIIWDHNKKQIKSNKYVEHRRIDNFFNTYFKKYFEFSNKNKRDNVSDNNEHDLVLEHNDVNNSEYIIRDGSFLSGTQDSVSKSASKSASKAGGFRAERENNNCHDTVCVVSIYIKAKDNQLMTGDQLLQALVSVGCRYGQMNIFHRYEKTSGLGEIMFSIASMVNPGVFDIDNISDFKTPGLIMFFTAPGIYDPVLVYDLMLKTAYKLAKFFDAEILDDARQLLTSDKVLDTKAKLEKVVGVNVNVNAV